MYFSNEFLYDFKPVYEGILAAKSVKPECAIVEVIDEEPEMSLMRLQFIQTGLHIFMSLQRQCMRRPDWFHLSYRKSVLD